MSLPNRPQGWDQAQLETWASEVLDTKKVLLHCGIHSYVGSDTPPQPLGCKNCWEAYWWFKIASTPPHLRMERLEKAMKMVRDANQAVEAGNFDFAVDPTYPQADIVKDGWDEGTCDYRKPKITLN